LTGYFPVSILLAVVGIIVSHESFVLIRGSRKKEDEVSNQYNNERDRGNGNNVELHIEGNTYADSAKTFIYTKRRLIILESVIGFGMGVLGDLVGSCAWEHPYARNYINTKDGIQYSDRNKSSSRICHENIWINWAYHKQQY
jgi:hypothetical protein